MTQPAASPGRIVIVSNRLPVTVHVSDGQPSYTPSVGGLATGIQSYLDRTAESGERPETLWCGWPGLEPDDDLRAVIARDLEADHGAFPVWLPADDADAFYHGFCNDTIWPLFHYFYVYTQFDEATWDAYVRVNSLFCRQLAEVLRPGDRVWIHDYHLMLLPGLLRARIPELAIGFFLHIPFPSFETFRLLPREWGRAILEGLLGCDLVGFHTHDYAQYYLRSVMRILGHDHAFGVIRLEDRAVKVDAFPMGIDFRRFHDAAESDPVRTRSEQLRAQVAGLKTILSVDRLDYSKGILNRLEGYDQFLAKNPAWHERVVLLAVVVPSRELVPQYDEMKQRIDQMVGTINGKYGSLGWTPIVYQYRSLAFEDLAAAYAASDVCLVTPLRDGMNLIAKEYIACNTDDHGVLILSEMAGAATELGEALILNPNSREEIADAIRAALEMPHTEQQRRNRIMRIRLQTWNVLRWAEDFLGTLEQQFESRQVYQRIIVSGALRDELIRTYAAAKRRLILTDYDGTLVGFYGDPAEARPKEWLLGILSRLAAQHRTEVALVSGRVRGTLEEWLGALDIGLAAEHGAFLRERGKRWQVFAPHDTQWKDTIRPLLQRHADRLPGAFVEEKEYCMVLHYRLADRELGNERARELLDTLTVYLANANVQVLQGSKVIEVRTGNINKGTAGTHFVQTLVPDFILAVGDDWTDEDLFRAMPPEAWTIKVGMAPSAARYAVRNHREVVELLEALASTG